jgi:drug/metabolite transporter (DMT)-like permease
MAEPTARERRIAYGCAFAVLFIWAGFMIFGRLSAKQAFTPYDVALLRYAGGFATALPIALLRGFPRMPVLRGLALTASAAYAFPIMAYIGFTLAPAAHGGVMLPGMLPFVAAALFRMVFRDPFSRARWISLGIVAAGIALLAIDTLPAHPGAWRGDLLFLGGTTAWAIYMVLVRHWRIGALDATLAVALLGLPLYLPVWWLMLPSNLAAVPLGPIVTQTIFQGAIALVLAGFLFTRAMATLGAARLTIITALVPGMAALAAWPLLDEPLGMAGIAGVGLVGVAIVLAVRGGRT